MTQLRLFTPEGADQPALSNDQAAELYLAERALHVQAGLITRRSYDRCEHYVRSFLDHSIDGERIGARSAGVGRNNDLTQWLLAHPTWKGTQTKSAAVSQVVGCFKWLSDEGYCSCPYSRPRFLGNPAQPRPAMNPDEYRRMLLASRRAVTPKGKPRRTRDAFRAAMIFLWRTGCRVTEMRVVRWKEVDWSAGVIRLELHKTAKTGALRMIPIQTVLPLLRWLSRRANGEHVFCNTLGRPWAAGVFAAEFRRYAKLANVRKAVSSYCMRHSLCVRLIEAGVSDRSIADVLGHSSTRYVSWYGEQSRTRADHLNDVIKRGGKPKRGQLDFPE